MARQPCKAEGCSSQPRREGYCIGCYRIKTIERVPNGPMRERYQELLGLREKSVLNRSICLGMKAKGFVHYTRCVEGKRVKGIFTKADSTHLRRKLGIVKSNPTRKRGKVYPGSFAQYLDYDEAVALCRALGMAPVEAGV